MLARTFLACLAWASASSATFGGSWNSGGAELLGDNHNPWFLNNTAQVSYCILIDDANFGAERPAVAALINKALVFWKTEYGFTNLPRFPDFGKLALATQNWVEKSCSGPSDESVDLRFQFGVLNPDQESHIQRPTSYAAIEIRTDYNADESQMRGKGFIYVSPMRGRLAYDGAASAPDLWQQEQGEFLYLLLLHELGHVFGLPHLGNLGELMSEGFADSVLKFTSTTHTHERFFQHFFSLPTSKQFCPLPPLSAILRKFFGSPDDRSCFCFLYTHEARDELFGSTRMQVFGLRDLNDSGVFLGEGVLHQSGYFPTLMTTIMVPPSQSLFSARDLTVFKLGNQIPGPNLVRVTKKGHFRTVDHLIDRNISVLFEQGKASTIGSGINDGELWDSFF